MVTSILSFFQKLDNLTRIAQNFILCKSVQYSRKHDDGTDLLNFRYCDPPVLSRTSEKKNHSINHINKTKENKFKWKDRRKKLSLSSWCITSLYIYHFLTVVEFSSKNFFPAIAFELFTSMARALG